MKYIIKPRASRMIFSFYQNVAKKYRHTYDKDDLKRNVYDAMQSIYEIERTLLRRKPTLSRWAGYHMKQPFANAHSHHPRSLVASRPQPRGKTPQLLCLHTLTSWIDM